MPLTKRAISPVNVSRATLPPNVTREELQCVANGSLANLIRQLSSLSKHAEHIVGEIYLDAMKLDHKSNVLQQRIERLMGKVTQLDSNSEQASLGEVQMRKAFKSSVLVDQHTLDRSTLPTALSEVYTKCDPPPNLDALNPYRDDPTSALSLYTNPSFFFDLWRKEMLKDCGEKRRVKSPSEGSKSPKKKRKPPTLTQDVTKGHRMTSQRNAPIGALSFPEEYQAPQAIGLQLNNSHAFQPAQGGSAVLPPPGMSVRAQSMAVERNDTRSSISPPKEHISRDLPPPDLSLLSIDDDDEDLPPPPPPLMHTSIVQHMPAPPQSNIQFVPSDTQAVAPPPPPPPPPPNFMAGPNTATFASSTPNSGESRMVPKNTPDSRNDLLSQIRNGIELKKCRRAEEEEAERVAAEQNDVGAILKRRMEHVMGNDDESQSSEGDDDEWDD